MQHFTFRPGPNGYAEEILYRGIHPMIAKRLHLWRLKNFNLAAAAFRRKTSTCCMPWHKDNPKDERLFACAEVRDLTPVRDETGDIVQLPHLERMFTEAVAAMRMFQAQRRPAEASLLEPHLSLRLAAARR